MPAPSSKQDSQKIIDYVDNAKTELQKAAMPRSALRADDKKAADLVLDDKEMPKW